MESCFSWTGLVVLIFLFLPYCPCEYSMESVSKTLGLEDAIPLLQWYPYTINLIFTIITIFLVWRYFDPYIGTLVPGAPVVGAGSRFEPLFITRYRFTFGSASIITNNWRKVNIPISIHHDANPASFW